MNLERKQIDFTKADVGTEDSGTLTGYASVFGNVDRAGEVVVQGAFKNIDAFLKDGFVALSHDWSELPIGTVSSVSQDDTGLLIAAEFHSTDEAQEARQVITERLARGKTVSMSIGYVVRKDHVEEDVRFLDEIDLYEVSIVTVPANPLAAVQSAKGAREMSFSDQAATLLADVGAFGQRLKGLKELRERGNRTLGEKAISESEEVAQALDAAVADLHALLEVPSDAKQALSDEGKLAFLEFLKAVNA